MPVPQKLLASFSPGEIFHVICKSIDGKKLFLNDANRALFLRRYIDLTNGFVDTYAYTLINNHVHWLIRIKSEAEIKTLLFNIIRPTSTQRNFLSGECSFHELIEQQFNRFFISYSLSFNNSQAIKGHLFNRPFKRIIIENDEHFSQLVIYIHVNAQKHGIVKDFRYFKWSSYHAIISEKESRVLRTEVLEWFGGKDRFIEIHKNQQEYYYQHIHSGE